MLTQCTTLLCACGCGKPLTMSKSRIERGIGKGFNPGHHIRPPKSNPLDRFWSHVSKSDGCWLWTASRTGFGYGVFNVSKTPHVMTGAHRYAYEVANGPIPDGMCVLHHCDTPSCVNPAHLFLGTNADNAADRHSKGRTVVGDRHGSCTHPECIRRGIDAPQAKLTDAKVRDIRRLRANGVSITTLATRFGVARRSVYNAAVGRSWSHVT